MAKPPKDNSPITEHLAYLLAQANREINRQLEMRLSKEGVPVEQWRILKVLSDGKGHSMGELAEAVLLNHPTLTKMVDRMVSDALVYRVQDPKDRRKVLMFVSDRGKALSKRLNSLAVSQEEHILESYGDKPTSELKRLLESLIDSSTERSRVLKRAVSDEQNTSGVPTVTGSGKGVIASGDRWPSPRTLPRARSWYSLTAGRQRVVPKTRQSISSHHAHGGAEVLHLQLLGRLVFHLSRKRG